MIDEQTLVESAQQGDLDAFNILVLEYQDIAFNVAYRVMSDVAAAEDASQEAFISAYKNIDSFRGGSFRSWLLRIVTNCCYDELRKRKRRPTVPLLPMDDDDEEIESPQWIADESLSPEAEVELKDLDKAVQHCLNDLKEEFRIVVVLVDIQGMDYKAVSESIQKPLGTVKSRLARARSSLQDCLQQFKELLPSIMRLRNEEIT